MTNNQDLSLDRVDDKIKRPNQSTQNSNQI